MTTIETNLQAVRQRIAAACAAAGRDAAQVQLLAVSKTFPAASVSDAIAAGQLQFGENYIQEAVAKIEALPRAGITWHCIGPVQSNKT
ncbi:MAG: YggS family pyridoxal phosphate enzyme, partial [Rhodoferax sp.]|nr:YggS family pyridoxal phosphate enzyme [Rhodoferax sp.]